MNKEHLIKSTGTIGIATAVSRVLGFIRDIIIAKYFGTSLAAQAFVVAFRIPNSLRDLVGEGATNAAVVPVLTSYRAKGDEKEFLHVARILFNISFALLSCLTVIGIIFSPLIVRLIAPGFISDPEKLELTIRMNRYIFPYLILIGLTAYSMGVLNAIKHFAAPAFGPAILNIALIATVIWLCPVIGPMGLVVGVLIGGTLQLFINVPVLYRRGITINFRDGFRHPAVKKIGKLLVPRAVGSAVYQINIFVDTILASLAWIVGSGGVAALYYANRLIQFPLAIFGLAIAQAALPKLSGEFASNDIKKMRDTISFSLRTVFFIMLPASFGLAILGRPIIRLLFERGEFTSYSTGITESALFFYSFGLVAYSGIKILVSSFYSMHDTMTPVRTASVAVILNIALNLILMWPLKLGGLALATSISATFNFLMLYFVLARRLGDFGSRQTADSFIRVLAASAIMGGVLKILLKDGSGLDVRGLIAAISVSIAVFFAAAYLLRVKELKDLKGWILKRR
ncbi:MAG: murein biosynthesis integral membrane protein MurJ [Candidatus Omnitrophica bacterium]|nr:murein biosynthesis integral membrane protein MurJ [Candidatus Omnitrophota bacterium]